MAIIGTGRQAAAQVAAAVAARPITCVRVSSPTLDHRVDFARRLAEQLGDDVCVQVADTVAEAVAGVDIVTTATRARQPFLDLLMLGTDVLVNVLGGDHPRARRAHRSGGRRRGDCGERQPAGRRRAVERAVGVTSVVALSAVVAGVPEQGAAGGRRLFKAMGLGLADVAVAAEVRRLSIAAGRGRPIPTRTKATPRNRSHRKARDDEPLLLRRQRRRRHGRARLLATGDLPATGDRRRDRHVSRQMTNDK